jgi:hypothetical protein
MNRTPPGWLLRFAIPLLALPLLAACGDDNSGGGDGGSGGSGASGTGAGAGTTTTGGGDAEPPEMNGMTAAHNGARMAVDPPADPPIPPLTWSGEVAAVAQAYAENCVFEHSNGDYGENLYASSAPSSPLQVVASWVGERADYDYATDTCTNVCGHYTQVVWRDSQRLGCGVANCTENSPFGSGSWQLWVCNYDPPGNYVGQKPY